MVGPKNSLSGANKAKLGQRRGRDVWMDGWALGGGGRVATHTAWLGWAGLLVLVLVLVGGV